MGVVFILGAGASVDAGAPLMGNFLDRSRDLYALGEVTEQESRQSFERVFQFISGLQAIHSKCYIDIRNVESILAALEMGKTLNWIPGYSREQIDELILDMSVVISVTIEKSLIFPITPGGALGNPVPYSDFANLVKNVRSHWKPSRRRKRHHVQL